MTQHARKLVVTSGVHYYSWSHETAKYCIPAKLSNSATVLQVTRPSPLVYGVWLRETTNRLGGSLVYIRIQSRGGGSGLVHETREWVSITYDTPYHPYKITLIIDYALTVRYLDIHSINTMGLTQRMIFVS